MLVTRYESDDHTSDEEYGPKTVLASGSLP